MKNHPNVVARPDLSNRDDLAKVVPLGMHGDGVAYMHVKRAGGKSLEVLSWASLLTKGPTRSSSFLIFLLVKSVVKDSGFLQSWPKAWKAIIWSLEAPATGKWPMLDWDKKEFPQDSLDYHRRGTPLAAGWCGVVFVLRADLEFLANHFHLNSPASNSPCALCRADRTIEGCPWTDVRTCAAWRATTWKPNEWLAENPTCHPFFRMAGSGLDLIFPDLMHVKHLGVDQLIIGSTITWFIRDFLPGSVKQNLSVLWEFIQNWYKERLTVWRSQKSEARSRSHNLMIQLNLGSTNPLATK